MAPASRSSRVTPAVLPSYLRALRSAVGVRGLDGTAPLPDSRPAARGFTVDPRRLSRYASVCGFAAPAGAGPSAEVPSPYPHVLAFPLQLALLTDRRFPFPVLGLVHVANRIEQRRPLAQTDRLDMAVYADRLAAHPRGSTFDLVTEARVGGELVWRESSRLLARHRRTGAKADSAAPSDPAVDVPRPVRATTGGSWQLPGDLGRRYASVSGDRNPIHLFDTTARPFGFRRHIVQGMWTLARAVADLGADMPPAHTLDVAFHRPIELPGEVCFSRSDRPGMLRFEVRSSDGERTHLTGECRTGWPAAAAPSSAR